MVDPCGPEEELCTPKSLDVENGLDQTSSWVMSGLEHSCSQMDLDDIVSHSDQSSQISPVTENEQLLSDELIQDQDSLAVENDSYSPDVQSTPDIDSPETLQQTDPDHDKDPPEILTRPEPTADTGRVVTTRAGRVSKKVSRLIETMVQKPLWCLHT